ncbi:MAG: deoxyguanosinetriphosphate triphosphohydrolase [Alphaproteobacteria bacterium]|nr:deoxyguanosinetriphosphate triphosphohydrolase [Alphaproteobacteria bacterium]
MVGPSRRAPFACDPARSRGRRHPEPESATRTCFQRDRDRIVHSTAFRRLKHKTQVFVYHEGDYYRTRLTHSLEVAQIARSISRQLSLDEDLTEALALAHDLGHTPFGHAGEEALHACMAPHGGFDHNAQTLRILTRLEQRYAEFDGLNLTWEALEGVVKHNGPLLGRDGVPVRPPLPAAIAQYGREHDLELATWPSAEAQVAALSDDIAYNNHDIDDGLRAGLFELAELAAVPLVGDVLTLVMQTYPGIERGRLVHETIRRVIDRMVQDLIGETERRITAAGPQSAAEVRALGRPLVAFSPAMAEHDRTLKDFLLRRMYTHYRLNRSHAKARRIVTDLFGFLLSEPDCLPDEWRARAAGPSHPVTARLVADYIAGMTDRYAIAEARRLFELDTGI